MTGMLASVTSIEEAKIVLNAGVDIVDIKNPHEGALGALETNAVKRIVQFVNQETLTSATIGDIDSNDPELLNYIINMSRTGVDYVKVGLFTEEASDYFIDIIKQAIKKDIKLVIVLFAENYKGVESIKPLMQTGISGIMIDTKKKQSKNLCAILDTNVLNEFVNLAKENNLLTGLAGSLKQQDVNSLLKLNADYLGFRGALCSQSDRTSYVNEEQVKKIRNSISYRDFNNFENRQYKEAIV